MNSALGVSVGAGAIRLVRPPAGAAPDADPASFEQRTYLVPPLTPSAERAALSVAAARNSDPEIDTVLACRDEPQARALHTAMNEHGLDGYDVVSDTTALLEFAVTSGALRDVTTLGIYDLGAAGLSVTVVDVPSRTVCHTERTGDISGEYFDSLIREQQINSGRIAHPRDPTGLAELDALCRSAKERLSASSAVALPSSYGPVLLTQENFTALIGPVIDTSARSAREVIARSGRQPQALLAVGGGVRIPLVSRTLREALEMPVLVPPQPESAAARGAALLARKIPRPPACAPAPSTAAAPAEPGPEIEPPQAGSPPVTTDSTRSGTSGSADTATDPAATDSPPAAPQKSTTSRPDLPLEHGIFGPPTAFESPPPPPPTIPAEPPDTRDAPHPAPAPPVPDDDPPPEPTAEEDPPTVALRIPAAISRRPSFDEPPQRRNREINIALVAVSALVVVAATGLGLGYGRHIFHQDSTTVEGTSRPPITSTTAPPAETAAPATTPQEHASIAEPPPAAVQPETETPAPTTKGPNTFEVPWLPPIVVPTIPSDALPYPHPDR